MNAERRRFRLSHAQRLALLVGALALCGWLAVALLLAAGRDPLAPGLKIGLVILALVSLLLAALCVRAWRRPWATAHNLARSILESDFRVRGNAARAGPSAGAVIADLNRLSAELEQGRHSDVAAEATLSRLIRHLDVAVLIFDDDERLVSANPAGCRLLGVGERAATGRPASALGVAGLLEPESPSRQIARLRLPGGIGPCEVHRVEYGYLGQTHRLLVMSRLGRLLAEQERQGWQRLVRVLAHELNNSLVPIKSLAEALRAQLERPEGPSRDDIAEGVGLIADRAGSLHRFVGAYSQLARIPEPRRQRIDIGPVAQRAAAMLDGEVQLPRHGLHLHADADQLEQVLINLMRNALEAGGTRAPELRWEVAGPIASISIEDWGTGLPEADNLFVPFFTTKPGGNGLGLVLCRQIADMHDGDLELTAAAGHPGCIATLRLPVKPGA